MPTIRVQSTSLNKSASLVTKSTRENFSESLAETDKEGYQTSKVDSEKFMSWIKKMDNIY
jgi:hypothetical protein